VHGSWYIYRVYLLLFPCAAEFSHHKKPVSGGTSYDVFIDTNKSIPVGLTRVSVIEGPFCDCGGLYAWHVEILGD